MNKYHACLYGQANIGTGNTTTVKSQTRPQPSAGHKGLDCVQ